MLGIAKREFHEEIIVIIKRKRQVPTDQEGETVKSHMLKHIEKMFTTFMDEAPEDDSNIEEVIDSRVLASEAKHVHFHDEEREEVPRSHFSRTHWARATTETIVKIGDFDEHILALIDHGSEINLMSKNLYQRG